MKQKVYNVKTWDDDSDSGKSNSDRDEESSGKNFLAFAAKHQESEKIDVKFKEEFVDFDELKKAYDKLHQENLNLTKQNIKLAIKSEASVVDLTKSLSSVKELSENLESIIKLFIPHL